MNTDIYYSFTYYDYDPDTYTYGDSYTGYGYADSTDGIDLGYLYQYDVYSGEFSGYYYIDYVYDYGYDYGWSDDVIVTSYSDADSGLTTYDVTTYGSTLGDEYGYADGEYFDSLYGYEADFSSSSTDDVYYSFTYYDADSGDSYSGYGYADVADGIEAYDYIYNYDDSTGAYNGYYYIDYAYEYGADYGYEDYGVTITSYTDYDSSGETTYDVTTYNGSAGLGDEYGYANGEYFSPNYGYDADWSSSSGSDDVYYSFTYYDYNSGDSYTGYGYGDASDGIEQYDYIYNYNDSSGSYNGYYYIDYAYEFGADYGYEDYGVTVTSYTDWDSSGETTYDVTTYGSTLGDEYGYANGNYFDSSYGYDADWSSSSGSASDDVYYTFTYYDYNPYTYSYEDSYTGWGVQDRGDTTTDDILNGYLYQYDAYSGDFSGYYVFDYVYEYGADYGYESYGVNVSSYTDANYSGLTTYDVTTYGSIIGDEYGYAEGAYFDALYGYDADLSTYYYSYSATPAAA